MARRQPNVFNLSFLDIMCCGFGAVILFYMIINTGSVRRTDERVRELAAEARLREEEILDGQRNLVVVRNVLAEVREEHVEAMGRSRRLLEAIKVRAEELAESSFETLAQREHVERLKADIESLEKEARRLEGASQGDEDRGDALRTVKGEGDRQYLTGLKVGGQRILILIDASASMLGDTVVAAVRRRHLSESSRRKAPKWRRAVSTVEWIAAHIPATSQFQLLTYNTEVSPLLEGTEAQWLAASAPELLDQAIANLQEVVPASGTSLHAAMAAVRALEPLPDNVFLLTDGLPTQGKGKPFRSTVSAEARHRHFLSAIRGLPGKIPMNVILFPMEGDPLAAISYWQLAEQSGGALISPARDWP